MYEGVPERVKAARWTGRRLRRPGNCRAYCATSGSPAAKSSAAESLEDGTMAIATLATIIYIVQWIIQLYIYIAAVIVSWLIAMGTLNMRNAFVRSFVDVLDRLTDPVFRRVRRFLPAMGPIDLSPMIVIIVLGAIGFVFLPTLLERLEMGSYF